MEMYQKWMLSSPLGEKQISTRYELTVRVVETEAGLSGTPKYNRTLAVCTLYDKVLEVRRRVALVHKKSGQYQIVFNRYNDRYSQVANDAPYAYFPLDSRIEAISMFEGKWAGFAQEVAE